MEGWRLKLFCMPNKKERKETKNKITSEEIEIMSTQKQAILSPVPYMNIKDSNSTLNMEATRSSETFVYNKPTLRRMFIIVFEFSIGPYPESDESIHHTPILFL